MYSGKLCKSELRLPNLNGSLRDYGNDYGGDDDDDTGDDDDYQDGVEKGEKMVKTRERRRVRLTDASMCLVCLLTPLTDSKPFQKRPSLTYHTLPHLTTPDYTRPHLTTPDYTRPHLTTPDHSYHNCELP